MVWVPNSPPEGYIHLKLNKGVYSLKTWDGEGVGSEDPAENVPFNFPGEKLSFFLWMEHRKGLEDSLVGGFSPTHLKNMLVKLDHFPKGWDEHKNVSNHLMFFLFNDTWTKEASPRTKDSEVQNVRFFHGKDWWWSSDRDPKKTSWDPHRHMSTLST